MILFLFFLFMVAVGLKVGATLFVSVVAAATVTSSAYIKCRAQEGFEVNGRTYVHLPKDRRG